MAKFNEVQKKRRAQNAERKRAIHGDPNTSKLKVKPQNQSVSGKRKRKLLKKWRRDQKEAAEKGLLTMQDVEMSVIDEDHHEEQSCRKASKKFPMKKAVKLNRKGKKSKRKSSKPVASQGSADAMVE